MAEALVATRVTPPRVRVYAQARELRDEARPISSRQHFGRSPLMVCAEGLETTSGSAYFDLAVHVVRGSVLAEGRAIVNVGIRGCGGRQPDAHPRSPSRDGPMPQAIGRGGTLSMTFTTVLPRCR
jgi:hypothetical protein